MYLYLLTTQINNVELSSKSQDDVVALLRALPVGATIRMRISRQPEAELQASSGSSELAGAGAGAIESSAGTSPLSISTTASAPAPVLEQSPARSVREAISPPPVSPRQAEPQFREFTIELPLGDWSAASASAQQSANLVGVNVHGRKKNVPADAALQPNAHAAREEDAGIFIKSISESGAAYRVFSTLAQPFLNQC